MRLAVVKPHLAQYSACRLLDIGCGWEARLLKQIEPWIDHGIGIDFKAPEIKTKKLETLSTRLDKRLPFPDENFDVVTMLAVLEHLDHPEAIVRECFRVMKPHGSLILTVPSWLAKPVLEFLAFRLGIINRQEILDHKRYFDRGELWDLFSENGFKIKYHRYFQFRMNNILVAIK